MAELYYREYGTKEKPSVLGNATEMVYQDHISESCRRINQLWNLSPKDKVFLFVGRINRLKNIFYLVDCLYLLNQRKLNYTYKMLFVGDGQDFTELKHYIYKKKMTDSIILCGGVKDRELLRDYYVRSDLFLFPSNYDASSIVQIEAASQKVPTIFLKGSITSSDVVSMKNGVIANGKKDFADKIDQLMNNPKLYKTIKEGAYQDIYRNWDMVVDDVFSIYLEMIH